MEDNYFTILWCFFFPILQHESATGAHVSPHPETLSVLPPHPIPLGWPRAPALSVLLQASDLHRSSIWHMVKGMFQCYSLKSSHSHLLPHRPKVSSLYLCVFCCLTYRIVVTIFLNSYTCVNILDWCFSFSYFILYNRLQFIYLTRTDLFEAFQRHQRHQWKSCQHTVILKGVCVCVCVCMHVSV